MRRNGFTLVEMLIVVTVGAILVTVALPSYQEYLRKARRSDGKEALLRLQLEQERFPVFHRRISLGRFEKAACAAAALAERAD